jgi:PRD1 phage membrane DNA delivery
MFDGPVAGVIQVATIIIGLAILTLLVAKKTQTAQVIQSFSSAFDTLLKAGA